MTIRRSLMLALVAASACSALGDSSAPVAIEFLVPIPAVVEIDDTLQLRARVLDQGGDSIAATIRWRSPDTLTVGVDSLTGRFWGIAVGTGRVQPISGSLVGTLVQFTVRTRTDTIVVTAAAESLLVVAADSESAALAPKVAQSNGTGLGGRTLFLTLVTPLDSTVRLTGNKVVDTATTAATGLPAVNVKVRLTGATRPDSAVVRVDAKRPSGTVVPGSGQVIRVFFQ